MASDASDTASPRRRLHAVVTGHVQGVYFRHNTQQTARQHGVTGWVRNNRDRSVEVVAEGSADALEHLLDFLHRGPQDARVDEVRVTWHDTTDEFTRFDVQP